MKHIAEGKNKIYQSSSGNREEMEEVTDGKDRRERQKEKKEEESKEEENICPKKLNVKTPEENGAKPEREGVQEKAAQTSQAGKEEMAEGKAAVAKQCRDSPAPETPGGKAPSGPASCLTAPSSVSAIH